MSATHETAVRKAADDLKAALEAAEKAGFRILGNVRPAMLVHVGLSGTAKTEKPAVKAPPEKPAPATPPKS
jgi:hypothetical protein